MSRSIICAVVVGALLSAGCAGSGVQYVDEQGRRLRTDNQGRPILPDGGTAGPPVGQTPPSYVPRTPPPLQGPAEDPFAPPRATGGPDDFTGAPPTATGGFEPIGAAPRATGGPGDFTGAPAPTDPLAPVGASAPARTATGSPDGMIPVAPGPTPSPQRPRRLPSEKKATSSSDLGKPPAPPGS